MLNDTLIRSLKPAEKPKKYADGGGLFLYVPPTGSKLWRLAYRFDKKSKLLSFGEYPAVSLKMARDRRDAAKRLLAEGIDPSQHKKTVQAAKIAEEASAFEKIAREWHETRTVDNSPADRRRKLYTLEKYLFPALGKMSIAKIEAPDLLAIVKPLEMEESVELAHRVLQYCGMAFQYAIATGKTRHNIVADMRGALRPKRPVHRASIIDTGKIGRLLLDLDEYEGQFQVRCALRLIPLFFVRASELRYAEWAEFDFDDRLWRIPADRMKMRSPHVVPLAKQSISILTGLREYTGNGRLVFPSARTNGRPIAPATMLHALRCMGYRKQELCVHGFRSTASTLLNELGYNRDWIERQLAHKEKNEIRAAYNYAQYLPQRRKMMDEWADYLDTLREKAREEKSNE
jgi:integrase